MVTVLISVVWLYGTLVLFERRSGYIIMLLLSLFSLVVPYVHMKGKGVGVTSRLGHTSGHFFFVWTLFAIGVLGLFSAILSARGLWSLPWRRSRTVQQSPTTRTWKGPSHGVGDRRGSGSAASSSFLPLLLSGRGHLLLHGGQSVVNPLLP